MSQSTGALRAQTGRSPGRAARVGVSRVSLRVVPAAIERSRGGVFAAACLLVLIGGLLTLLVLHTHLAQGSFVLHDLKRQSGALADSALELNRAMDQQRAPANLAAKAKALGMVPASSMAFIRLQEGTIVGVAQPAPGAPVAAAPVAVAPAAAAAPAAPAAAQPATTPPATTTPAPSTSGAAATQSPPTTG